MTTDASLLTFGAYAAYSYDVIPNLTAKVRAGLLYKSLTMEAEMNDTSMSVSDSEMGAAFGVGLNYTINKELDVYTNYTIVDADIAHITLGAQYRF